MTAHMSRIETTLASYYNNTSQIPDKPKVKPLNKSEEIKVKTLVVDELNEDNVKILKVDDALIGNLT